MTENLIGFAEIPHVNYTQIPNIVDDMDLDPYAFRLYVHLRRRAGNERGACWERTEKLAEACHMSVGKVSQSKGVLVESGLITIEKRVCEKGKYDHITLVDIWEANYAHKMRCQLEPSSPSETGGGLVHLVKDTCSPGETKKTPSSKNTQTTTRVAPETIEEAKQIEQEWFGDAVPQPERNWADPEYRNQMIQQANQRFAERAGQAPWGNWFSHKVHPRGGVHKLDLQHVGWLVEQITSQVPNSDSGWGRWRKAYQEMFEEAHGDFDVIEQAIHNKWDNPEFRTSNPELYVREVAKVYAECHGVQAESKSLDMSGMIG